MKQTDLIISINVHEKPEYFEEQLKNINENVELKKEIILNCNQYMFDQLSKKKYENVTVNPVFFEKRPHHGSIAKGIFTNLLYALENFDFKFFIVMSSREFYYNKLNSLEQIIKNKVDDKFTDYDMPSSWWDAGGQRFSEFFKYLRENKLTYNGSAHEGVAFTKLTCEYIKSFADNNGPLMETAWNLNNAAEEWILQSIASNYGNHYYIGNGVYNKSLEECDPNRLTLKKSR